MARNAGILLIMNDFIYTLTVMLLYKNMKKITTKIGHSNIELIILCFLYYRYS